jgi:rod shape-determining protein MreB
VVAKSLRIAGNKLDDAIASWVRKNYSLIVGETTAEEIKILIGSALIQKENKKISIKGRDSISGLPKKIEISANDISDAIKIPLGQIVGLVKSVLEDVPPELASDIIDKGIVLSGGTSLLRNLDRLLTEQTGVACHVTEEPLLAVIKGIGMVLENLEMYKRSITKR